MGLGPSVEAEVLMAGDHTLSRCGRVTEEAALDGPRAAVTEPRQPSRATIHFGQADTHHEH